MTNPQAQAKYFEEFSQYLVASCWPKMYERANHWSSKGFCYYLCQFSEIHLALAYDAGFTKQIGECSPKRRDAVLAKYFLGGKDMGLLQSIMEQHPHSAHRTSQLPHLTAAFRTVRSSETVVHIYGRETCSEFHQFLVALLRAYIKSLEALKREPSKRLGVKFYNLAIFLWKVARSRILQIHLRTLHAATKFVGVSLGMPADDLEHVYSAYFMRAQGRVETDKQVEGGKGKEGEGDGKRDGSEGQDLEKDLENLRQLWDHGLKKDSFLVYHGWLGLLSAHFESLDILSRFCTRSHKEGIENIQVKLLAVTPSNRMLSKFDWKSIVMVFAESQHNTASDSLSVNAGFTREDAETTVALLQNYIDRNNGSDILDAFRHGPTLPVKVHCEAAMASLMQYPDSPNCGIRLPSFTVRFFIY